MEKGPLNAEQDKYLRKIYYNPSNPASYGGINRLYKHVKKDGRMRISKGRIKRWLAEQDVYTKFRPIRTEFKRLPIYSSSIGYQWEADLIDMNKYKKENENYTFILLCIDTFSKKVWTKPLKTKNGKEVAQAFDEIFKENKAPRNLRTDKGTEFRNSHVREVFDKYNVNFFTTQNETKCAIAERAVKTIKGKVIKMMAAANKHVWIDDLQDITLSYNNAVHSSTKMIPNKVSDDDQAEIWENLYEKYPPDWGDEESPSKEEKIKSESSKSSKKKRKRYFKKFKFKIGDQVRVSVLKGKFSREYSQRFTDEIFEVADRFMKNEIALYVLRDQNREPIEGVWYTEELQRVFTSPDKLWAIEEILDTKTEVKNRKKRQLSYVKWVGWPKAFNTWIPTSDIQDIENLKESTNQTSQDDEK